MKEHTLQRVDIQARHLYAAGFRNSTQYPALVLDTDLWTFDRHAPSVIRGAREGERSGRRTATSPGGGPDYFIDTGVLALRPQVLATLPEKVLPLLRAWDDRLRDADLRVKGAVDRMFTFLNPDGLTPCVLTSREVMLDWDTYADRSEFDWLRRQQRIQVAEKELVRREYVVSQVRELIRIRGLDPRLEISHTRIDPCYSMSVPDRISLTVDEMLAVLSAGVVEQSQGRTAS